jgi:hypothetical protein
MHVDRAGGLETCARGKSWPGDMASCNALSHSPEDMLTSCLVVARAGDGVWRPTRGVVRMHFDRARGLETCARGKSWPGDMASCNALSHSPEDMLTSCLVVARAGDGVWRPTRGVVRVHFDRAGGLETCARGKSWPGDMASCNALSHSPEDMLTSCLVVGRAGDGVWRPALGIVRIHIDRAGGLETSACLSSLRLHTAAALPLHLARALLPLLRRALPRCEQRLERALEPDARAPSSKGSTALRARPCAPARAPARPHTLPALL